MNPKTCSGLIGILLSSFLSGKALAKRELQYPLATVPFYSAEYTTVNWELARKTTFLAEQIITRDDHPQLLKYHRDVREEDGYERVKVEFQIGLWRYFLEVTNGGKSSWDILRFEIRRGKGSKKKIIYGVDDGLDGNADDVYLSENLKEKHLEDFLRTPITLLSTRERAQRLYQTVLERGIEFYEKK